MQEIVRLPLVDTDMADIIVPMLISPYTQLSELTSNIIKRSQPFALRKFAKPLFDNAIQQAEVDVKQAYNELSEFISTNVYYEDEASILSYFAENNRPVIYGPDGSPSPPDDVLYRTVDYFYLRLYWLREMRKYIEVLIRNISDDNYSGVNRVDRLIKPADIDIAAECFEAICERTNQPKDNYAQYLGQWYSAVLYTCGATKEELIQIQGNYSSWAD